MIENRIAELVKKLSLREILEDDSQLKSLLLINFSSKIKESICFRKKFKMVNIL